MSNSYYHVFDVCPHCGRGRQAEIGLASAGWRFLFQQGGWVYWRERLKAGTIIDEAGRSVSLETLTRLVREHQTLNSNRNCGGMRGLRFDNEGYEYIEGGGRA